MNPNLFNPYLMPSTDWASGDPRLIDRFLNAGQEPPDWVYRTEEMEPPAWTRYHDEISSRVRNTFAPYTEPLGWFRDILERPGRAFGRAVDEGAQYFGPSLVDLLKQGKPTIPSVVQAFGQSLPAAGWGAYAGLRGWGGPTPGELMGVPMNYKGTDPGEIGKSFWHFLLDKAWHPAP